MGESRDANDPRETLRALQKETRSEFERAEEADTGGQEHASAADRDGEARERRPGPTAPGADEPQEK